MMSGEVIDVRHVGFPTRVLGFLKVEDRRDADNLVNLLNQGIYGITIDVDGVITRVEREDTKGYFKVTDMSTGDSWVLRYSATVTHLLSTKKGTRTLHLVKEYVK